jgi:hypothetical protein
MTKKNLDFKVPTLKRAIKAAHTQQLVVDSYDIRPDGTIHVHVRDYEIANGKVRVLTAPRPIDRENVDLSDRIEELDLTGEAA